MRLLKLLVGGLAAALAVLVAVLAAGRATDHRKNAAREKDLERAVTKGTSAARIHREAQRKHEENAARAEATAKKKLAAIAKKDSTLEALMTEFNAERDR